VEETGVPGENHRPTASHRQTLEFELTTLVVIDTDCIGSYKSNYHMITATMAPEMDGRAKVNWNVQSMTDSRKVSTVCW
jgi:hypothetical protein